MSNILEQMPPPTRFTPLQHEMLRLFNRNTSEEDLLAIKDLIANYFLEKLRDKIDKAVEEHGYTQEDFDAWLNDPNQ
ncbi:hypothetical protein [Foetidibacter luteolus]|uniref:hypothetical protein n=1 Tax=Foetidibacter luteolus TaxID=2608880 RepID=UPI00129AF180|nr:hypothetical protein [Foetidibacter luteolus]